MSQIIECLHFIEQGCPREALAANLGCSWLQALDLVAKINTIEPGLIITNDCNKFSLSHTLDWFEVDQLNVLLSRVSLTNYTVQLIPEIPSTNSYILNNLGILRDKSVVLTEFQNQGRGRRSDKRWWSKIALDLTFSCVYFFAPDFNYKLLPLVTAIAVNRLLKKYAIVNYIKWPNDIYTHDYAKIAGVLVESGIYQAQRFVVIGIGLNNIHVLPRNQLLCDALYYLDQVLEEYRVHGFGKLRQEWLTNCLHYKKSVMLYKQEQLLDSGINIDLTLDGELVLQHKHQTKYYISSNLSLRVDRLW